MALIVLDAGVVIGVLDADDPHHEAAVEVLRSRRERGDQLILPVSAYAEILVGPFRRGDDAVARAEAFLADVGVRIEPAVPDIARLAGRLRATHGSRLRLPDALVIATAEAVGADAAITTDGRWPTDLPVPVEVI